MNHIFRKFPGISGAQAILLLACVVSHEVFSQTPVQGNVCKPAHGEISFEDADGGTEEFANLKFSIRRASDDSVVYQGTTDSQGKAKWQGGCEGEDIVIRQDGFIDEN